MNARVPAAELRLYRTLTFHLLRKYFRLSLSLGRLPSLVGRECFRTQYELQHHTFEDSVIFVHDMERCLQRLDALSQEMISLIVFQDFSWEQCARLLNCPRRSVNRRLPQALDLLTRIMLRVGLIEPFACHEPAAPPAKAKDFHRPQGQPKTCQEPKSVTIEDKLYMGKEI
jgi:hypothetical protein